MHLEDVKITLPGQEPVKIEEITLNDFDSKHNIPEFLDVDIDGIEAKKSFNSLGFGDIFDGMDEVNMNLALKYEFTISIDPKKPVSLQEMQYGSMDKNLKKLNLEID